MNLPLVSIVIPTFNREKYISDCICSALSQTYQNIEIIVVDNNSSDKTVRIVRKMAELDSRIKLYKNNDNIGPVNNWIISVKKAKGEYIKLLFSDDMIENTFISETLPVLEKDHSIGFVYTKVKVFNGSKIVREYGLENSGKFTSDVFMDGAFLLANYITPVSPGCALFRKNNLSIRTEVKNKLNLKHVNTGGGVDLLVFLDIFKKYKYFYYINRPLSLLREHSEGISVANNLYDYYMTARCKYCEEENLLNYALKINTKIFIQSIKQNKFFINKVLNKYYYKQEYQKIDIKYLLELFKRKIFRLMNRKQ